MKRKDPFKNAVKKKGYFKKEITIHDPYERARNDYKKPNNDFKYSTINKAGYFNKLPGREIDKYDEEKQKYFEKPARQDGTTITVVTKNPDGTVSKEKQAVKWHATKHK